MRGAVGYLVTMLLSSGAVCGDELIVEASIEMAGKLAPGGQPGRGVKAGAGVRCQVASFDGPQLGLPGSHAGGVLALPCPPWVIAAADAMVAG